MHFREFKKRVSLSAALVYMIHITGILSSDSEMAIQEQDSRLVKPLVHFTSKLFRQVRQEKENIVISPISIHSALNMVLLGARSGSATERELIEALGYSNLNGTVVEAYLSYANLLKKFRQLNEASSKAKQKPQPSSRRRSIDDKYTELDVWNMAIVKNNVDLNPNYLDDVKAYYSSAVKRIRDDQPEEKRQLVDSVNKWAKDSGFDNGVIKKDDLDAKFSILLLSAIQVQGYWFDELSEHEVENAFYNYGLSNKLVKRAKCLSDRFLKHARYLEFTKKQPNSSRQARLSSNEQRAIEELAGPTFHTVDIPLKDKLSLTIFEPMTNGSGNELAKLEDHLLEVDSSGRQFKLHRALQLLDDKAEDTIEYIQFPKFKFESDLNLEKSLQSIGVQKIFTPEADLSKIAQSGLYVSKVKHQAVIEVNKLGLKAAGITSVRVSPLSLITSPEPIRLLIKNPFMFVVRYDKVPLFIGHLVHV